MQPNEYAIAQKRTESEEQNKDQKILNYILGLCGETGELFSLINHGDEHAELEILKECGDLTWYSCGLSRQLGWEFEEVAAAFNMENDITKNVFRGHDIMCFAEELVIKVAELADMIKKTSFHGHPVDKKIEAKMFNRLGQIVFFIRHISHEAGWTFEEVMSANVEKLQKRYKNGFSPEASINREA